MKKFLEENLMEIAEGSQEAVDFANAADSLAVLIRKEAETLGYDLERACRLVEGGELYVHLHDERDGSFGFTGAAGLGRPLPYRRGLWRPVPQNPVAPRRMTNTPLHNHLVAGAAR